MEGTLGRLVIQLQTRMACSFSDDFGPMGRGRNASLCDQALPNLEALYPCNVCWTVFSSPDDSLAIEYNDEMAAVSRPKKPFESAMLRQEMFRSGRRAAYSALLKAGYNDPISMSEENSKEHFDSIADTHRISVVGKNPDRSPCWPSGFVGSISHSNRWVLAAAARSSDYQSIGIDTEVVVAKRLAEDLQPNIGTASEWKLLDEAGIELTSAFTLLFSAKESFYKCWYPLKKKFMDHLDVAAFDIKPDHNHPVQNIANSPANYGVIALQPSTSLAYDDKREGDAMQLEIRYCITPADVFTIATLKKHSENSLHPNPKRERGADSIVPHNKTNATPILKS